MLEGDPTKSRIYKDMGAGVATAGIEYHLPLFLTTRPPYLITWATKPRWCCTATWNPPSSASGRTRKTASVWCRATPSALRCRPNRCFSPIDQFYTRANRHAQLSLRPGVQDVDDNPHFQKLGDLSVVRGAEDPLARLHAHIRNTQHRVLLLAESDGRRESLLDFCALRR